MSFVMVVRVSQYPKEYCKSDRGHERRTQRVVFEVFGDSQTQ